MTEPRIAVERNLAPHHHIVLVDKDTREVIETYKLKDFSVNASKASWSFEDSDGGVFTGTLLPVNLHDEVQVSPCIPIKLTPGNRNLKVRFQFLIPADTELLYSPDYEREKSLKQAA